MFSHSWLKCFRVFTKNDPIEYFSNGEIEHVRFPILLNHLFEKRLSWKLPKLSLLLLWLCQNEVIWRMRLSSNLPLVSPASADWSVWPHSWLWLAADLTSVTKCEDGGILLISLHSNVCLQSSQMDWQMWHVCTDLQPSPLILYNVFYFCA